MTTFHLDLRITVQVDDTEPDDFPGPATEDTVASVVGAVLYSEHTWEHTGLNYCDATIDNCVES